MRRGITHFRLRHALQLSWGFSRRSLALLPEGGCGESGVIRGLVLAPWSEPRELWVSALSIAPLR